MKNFAGQCHDENLKYLLHHHVHFMAARFKFGARILGSVPSSASSLDLSLLPGFMPDKCVHGK